MSLVARSALTRDASSCGRSSMKEVVARPCWKTGSDSTASRNEMLVETPRMRNSARARRARRTAIGKVRPRQVSLTSIESKWALTSAPTKTVPPSRRTPPPPAER